MSKKHKIMMLVPYFGHVDWRAGGVFLSSGRDTAHFGKGSEQRRK